MRAHQAEQALQAAPVGGALAEHDAAGDRHPMQEGLPAGAAEREPGCRRETARSERRNSDCQPAPVRDQHDRKQQPELRLVAQKSQAQAGKRRMPLQEPERAADQRRGEEAVLARRHVPERSRKSEREEDAGAASQNSTKRRGVGGERCREPDESRDKVRQRRERGGDEQEWRRVMPAVVVRKVMADGAHFGCLVQGPVVGGSGIAIEREASRGPHIDEIVGDRPALRRRAKSCRRARR